MTRSAAFIALYFFLGVFINGFTGLPVTFLLKERLRLDPFQIAVFGTMKDWAWYVKPVFGVLSDRVPIAGMRRRPYLALMGGLLTLTWCYLAARESYSYGSMLGAMALSAMALAFLNTVTAGLLAELSRVNRSSGRLNSLRQLATQFALVAAGPAGGWAAAHWPFQRVAAGAAAAAALLLAGAWLLVREPRVSAPAAKLERPTAPRPFVAALRSSGIWLALLLIVLVELSPGFNTPLLFFQQDVLHFRKEWFGTLQMTEALAAIVAAAGYSRLCRSRPLAAILPAVLVGHSVATLAWLGLQDPSTALGIKALTGFTLALTNLAIFDLATRAAPAGAEGTVLAAIFAGVNIAQKGSDLIGSGLYRAHWSLAALVVLNAGTTLLAVSLVPFLPHALVRWRDGEQPDGAPQK